MARALLYRPSSMRKQVQIYTLRLVALLTVISFVQVARADYYSDSVDDPAAKRESVYVHENRHEPGRFIIKYCHSPGNCELIGSNRGYTAYQFKHARALVEEESNSRLVSDLSIGAAGALGGLFTAMAFSPDFKAVEVIEAGAAETEIGSVAVATAAKTVAPRLKNNLRLRIEQFLATRMKNASPDQIRAHTETVLRGLLSTLSIPKHVFTPRGFAFSAGAFVTTSLGFIKDYYDRNSNNLDNIYMLNHQAHKYLDPQLFQTVGQCVAIHEPIFDWVRGMKAVLDKQLKIVTSP